MGTDYRDGGFIPYFGFAEADNGSDCCDVTITAYEPDGTADTRNRMVLVWLSDATDGDGLTSTTVSSDVTVTTGTEADTMTDKKAWIILLKDGVAVLHIEDSAETGFYVCVQDIENGKVYRWGPTADYGA